MRKTGGGSGVAVPEERREIELLYSLQSILPESRLAENGLEQNGELKGADRFQLGTWTTLATGALVLQGASGVIDCQVEETIERFGTVIVIGRLVDFTASDSATPMISYRGKTL